jgi:transposase
LKKYDGRTQIQSPHDPEARWSRKRHFEWIGDKVQVTETEDAGYPHIITDVVATSSNQTDHEELPAIQMRLEQRQCKPAEQYVDAGYMSGPALNNSQINGIELIGPLANFITPQDMLPDGITQSYFQIDAKNNIVICPKGQVATNPVPVNNSLSFRFPLKTCAACELRPRCCTGKAGRTIGISAYYELTEAARARQKTEAFKKDYAQHRSGVEGTLSALVRGNGMRVGRYIGNKKRNLQAIFTGCAANLKRTAHWLAGERPQIRHKKSWTLRPA